MMAILPKISLLPKIVESQWKIVNFPRKVPLAMTTKTVPVLSVISNMGDGHTAKNIVAAKNRGK